jgi:dsDNA-specific endonuclease/ATPase MutS2
MKIGDKIAVIDDRLEGIVTAVSENNIHFETDEGFQYIYPMDKVVVIASELQEKLNKQKIISKDKDGKLQQKKKYKQNEIPVFDLHIEKIQARHKHLSVAMILEIQMKEVERIIHKMKRSHYKQFILIHGEGKGILRKEIVKVLKYKGLTYTDASYQKYGNGAILVICR